MGGRNGGRKPFEPTPEQRGVVEAMIGYGATEDEIALIVVNPVTRKSIDPKTLRKAFRKELNEGRAKVLSKLRESLYVQAIGAPAVYDAAGRCIRAEQKRVPNMGMFLAKTQLGFRETDRLEVTGNNGAPLIVQIVRYSDGDQAPK